MFQTAAVRLYAFVLMDNHFHLLVRTPRANFSRFMQRLSTAYALYCRYKHHQPGHQLEGRFKAKLVEDETYLLALTRYIHLNPLKTAAGRRLGKAQRARRLEEYPWSSYPGYVSAKYRRTSSATICCRITGLLWRPPGETIVLTRTPVSWRMIGRCWTPWRPAATRLAGRSSSTRPRGGCVSAAAAGPKNVNSGTAAADGGRPADQCRGGGPLPTRPVDLNAHGHHSGEAKLVALELACRLTGWTQRAIGEYYGGISSAAVSVAERRKVRQRGGGVVKTVERLSKRLREGREGAKVDN